MKKVKKALLPLIAAGIMAGTFTIAAAETNGTNAVSRAQPKVAEESTEAVSEVADPEIVKRAEAGDTEAQRELALRYLVASFKATGEKAKELERAAKLWQKRRAEARAAREGDFESVRKRAEAGEAAAQRALGFRYSLGVGVEKNEKIGFEWTKKAAEAGDAKAQFNLAGNYADGRSGVKADPVAATYWYRKALPGLQKMAESGAPVDVKPSFYAGVLLLGEGLGVSGEILGRCVVEDEELGMGYIRLAAKLGDDEAKAMLETCESKTKDTAQIKEPPPAWVVSSTGTVARAEAGDTGAMEEIAGGYISLAMSSNTESTDEERMAMIREATKWMHRRAKVVVKTPEIQARAEKGDEAAMMDMARGYLFLAAARTMEAKGEERKTLFQKSMGWLRRRAEKPVASGDADAIAKVAKEIMNILEFPEFNLNEEEQEAVCREVGGLIRRRNKIMADREGDVESVRKRAEAGDPAAQRALGFRYSQGVDVEKDEKKGFEWTKKAALQDDAKAMLNLANDFAHGTGTAKNETAAVAWYRKAAAAYLDLVEKGEKLDVRPLVYIGQKLLEDESLDVPDVGMMFLGVAAQCGDAEALRLAGEQFAIGKAVERNYNTALTLLRKASRRGDKQALTIIGQIHEAEWCRLRDEIYEKAKAGDKEAADKRDKIIELLRKGLQGQDVCILEAKALAGYAPMQAELGRTYMLGDWVAQDKAKGVEWLRRAVDQGECRAMFWLGIAYERGDGVAKDEWRAVTLWQKSHNGGCDFATDKLISLVDEYKGKAGKGDTAAQFFLGVAYEHGYAVQRDLTKAIEWYRKAAKQGHPGAQTFLAYALLTGPGIAKDPEQAVVWFRKAAEQGNPEAQQNLGRCLFCGEGCKTNQKEAVSWYRKAAEQGEAGAMFNLGACYMEGTGVKKNVQEAKNWFKRAASLGHERSAGMLEMLQKDSVR